MLEQIKKDLADNHKYKFQNWNYNRIINEFDIKQSFEYGFDSCMNLELPIKFAEWYSTEGLDNIVGLNGKEKEIEYKQFRNKGVTKELFNYWLNNVYGK